MSVEGKAEALQGLLIGFQWLLYIEPDGRESAGDRAFNVALLVVDKDAGQGINSQCVSDRSIGP